MMLEAIHNTTEIPMDPPFANACNRLDDLSLGSAGGILISCLVSDSCVSGYRILDTIKEHGIDMMHDVSNASPETPKAMYPANMDPATVANPDVMI